MIIKDGQVLRNLQEQVEKNKDDILYILEQEGTLNQFGITVVGQVAERADIPDVETYKKTANWKYGDAFAVGTDSPYELYILTRANGTHVNDYWFDIGKFPMPGPQGPQGERGEPGGGLDAVSTVQSPYGQQVVTYDTQEGMTVHGNTLIGWEEGEEMKTVEPTSQTNVPIVFRNGLKADVGQNNDILFAEVDFEKTAPNPERNTSIDGCLRYQSVLKRYLWSKISLSNEGGSIVCRTDNGRIRSSDPEQDNDCVNLKYFNANKGGGMSWHTEPPTDTSKVVMTSIVCYMNREFFSTYGKQDARLVFTVNRYLHIDKEAQLTDMDLIGIPVGLGVRDDSYAGHLTIGTGTFCFNSDEIQPIVTVSDTNGNFKTVNFSLSLDEMDITEKYLY